MMEEELPGSNYPPTAAAPSTSSQQQSPFGFISESDFHKQVDEERVEKAPVLQWIMIPREEIFKIVSIEKRTSIYGPCWLTTAVTRDQATEVVFFAPRSLVKYVKEHLTKGRVFYFVALGQVR